MTAKAGLADRWRRWAVVDPALEEFSPPAIEPNLSERRLDRQDRYLVTLLGENLAVASVRLLALFAMISAAGAMAAYLVM